MSMKNTNGKVKDYYQCTDKRDAPRMENNYIVKVQCPRSLPNAQREYINGMGAK